MIFFIHIPKTAGTTFYDVVKKNYSFFLKPKIENDANKYLREKICNIDKTNFAIRLPGGYCSAPMTLNVVKDLPENDINKIKFVGGHVGYGFHEYTKQEVKYISFIRNPKKRLISDYYEHKKEGRHFNEILKSNDYNFNDYLRLVLDSKLDNLLTRQLLGPHDFYLSERKSLNKEMVETAIENAENVTFFDVNKFDEALYFLKEKFKWKNLRYEIKNVSSHKKDHLDYDEELLNQVIKFDFEIYEYLRDKVVNKKELNFIQKILIKF